MIEQMVMAKRYPMREEKPQALEEPAVAYGVSARERDMTPEEWLAVVVKDVAEIYADSSI